MKRTNTTPVLYILGSVLLVGIAACMFVYNCFNDDTYEIDTYDEFAEDYL